MKILAIRGKDLASLEGPFELSLERPPLEGAGLFLISGPTGAGKSTLLDCMCLALFDRTPRLGERGGALIGRAEDDEADKLSGNDVRNLLRRGAGAGFAEVEFIGQDERPYVATWSVARARNKATGRVQPQTMALVDRTSGKTVAAGRKTDVLEAIRQAIGLSYEQFVRSALLAQGDFAAFLKSDARQRAELLEKITGTSLYSALSKAAYQRGDAARKQVAEIERQLDGLLPLDEAARAEAEAALASARQARGEAEESLKALDAARTWYAERASRLAALQEADAALADQRARWAEAAPEHERLAVAEQVERHRAAWSTLQAAESDVAIAEAGLAEAGRAQQVALSERAAAQPKAEAAQSALAEERRRQDAEAPRLAQAKQLAWEEAQLETARVAAQAKLAAREGAEAGLDACRSAHEQAKRALDEAQVQRARVQEATAQAATNSREDVPAALRSDRERLIADDAALAMLGVLLAESDDLGQRQRALDARLEAASARRDEAKQAHAVLETELAHLTGGLESAEQAAERLDAVLHLSRWRSELVPGEPCPLCGSCAHPGHGEAEAALASATNTQRAEVSRLRAAREQALQESAALLARQHEAERDRLESEEARQAHHTLAVGLLSRWEAARAAWLALPPVLDQAPAPSAVPSEPLLALIAAAATPAASDAPPASPREAEARTWLDDTRSALDARWAAWRARENRHAEAQKAREVAQAAFEAAQLLERQAFEALQHAEQAERERAESLAEVTAAEARLAVLRVERQAYWEGEAPENLEPRWRARLDELQRESDAARAALDAAQQTASAAEAALTERRRALEAATERAISRRQALSEALEATPWSLDTLPSHLADPTWLEAARVRQTQLKEALTAAETRYSERRSACDALETSGRPAWEESALAGALAEARETLAAREEVHHQARTRLERDDEARARGAELAAQLEATRRETARWEALSGLIGSADGARFRKFAQGLTLQMLLEAANIHLAELAPRYRLLQVPGQDLELQILDLEMGEEIRALQSLSGGETFLASLALALGLSSVASQHTRIRSLFIDEGFGSLDAATLDVALDTLDALQASGRQVGLISHVPGLIERIGAQVRVAPRSNGRSTLLVTGRGASTAERRIAAAPAPSGLPA